MIGFRPIVGVIALTFHLAGCASTYREVAWPSVAADPAAGATEAADLKPGDRVRITLVDGERVTGKLVDRDHAGLTMLEGNRGSEGGDPVRIARERVVRVEEIGINPVPLIIGAVVVVGIAVAAVAAADTMDDPILSGGG